MVKKLAIALLCATLGTTLYARDDISQSKPFIGLEIGYATVQGDVGAIGIIRDYEGSDIEYGIRIGAKKEEWRTTLSFNYFDSVDDYAQNYEKYLASFDYFFLASNKSNFQPYLGVNVGYINYESDSYLDSHLDEQDIDMSGFIYGAQVGVLFSVTENIDLDIMYRYSISNATMDSHDDTPALDHIGSIVFGINYIY